jgi:hypothetical protein
MCSIVKTPPRRGDGQESQLRLCAKGPLRRAFHALARGDKPLAAKKAKTKRLKETGFRGFLARFGPGFIAGASDDDPSGIGTYSQGSLDADQLQPRLF